MKRIIGIMLFYIVVSACSQHKHLMQTTSMQSNDSFIQNINSSTDDTEIIVPHLKTLQQQNDLVIAFGTLNYAWARKGTYYVLASHNNTWKFYSYEAKLPPSSEDETAGITPLNVSNEVADKIKQQYTASELWKTDGDNGENFCSDKKDCNINDAETWTLIVTTPQHIHTTVYYAPEFFEECCPGNQHRKAFIAIAKEMMKLAPAGSSGLEK